MQVNRTDPVTRREFARRTGQTLAAGTFSAEASPVIAAQEKKAQVFRLWAISRWEERRVGKEGRGRWAGEQ